MSGRMRATEIWGHENLDKHKRADSGVSILSGNFGTRLLIQFGPLHPAEGPDAFPNKLGFGPEKFVGEKSYRPPTKNIRGWKDPPTDYSPESR